MKTKKSIILFMMLVTLVFQTSKAGLVYCPTQILCNKDIHNNFVCSSKVNTGFTNWVAWTIGPVVGPRLYLFTSASASETGEEAVCQYLPAENPRGIGVTLVSLNTYYPIGENWHPLGMLYICPPAQNNEFIPPDTCPLSTTNNNKFKM